MVVSEYEAALNRLREERLAVRDIREAILADEGLKASDAAHRRQLLSQTLLELAQLGRAIDLLTRLEAGEVLVVEVTEAGPGDVFDVPEIPRQSGLIRRFRAEPGAVSG